MPIVIVPPLAVSWISTWALPASRSAIATPAIAFGVSSTTAWVAAGTVLTGASLTPTTVIDTVSVSLFAPPLPVLPRSLVVIVNTAVPAKFAVGVYVTDASAVLIALSVP